MLRAAVQIDVFFRKKQKDKILHVSVYLFINVDMLHVLVPRTGGFVCLFFFAWEAN